MPCRWDDEMKVMIHSFGLGQRTCCCGQEHYEVKIPTLSSWGPRNTALTDVMKELEDGDEQEDEAPAPSEGEGA